MWQSERVDDALRQLLNDLIQTPYVLKSDGNISWTNDFHRYRLLVGRQDQVVPLRFFSVIVIRRRLVFVVGEVIVLFASFWVTIAEDALKSGRGGERFLLRLGFGACFGIETGEDLTGKVERQKGLSRRDG